MKERSIPHVPALDGLRGLGVLGVLLFHAGHMRGGWLGVDLFFVLSGYLITLLLVREFEQTGDVSIRRFWGRRARRLLPALLLTLFGVEAYALGWAPAEQIERIRADALATLFYVANWHSIIAGHDYWALFHAPSPLHHTWSLAVEEQFYIFWPPLTLALLRWRGGSRRALFWLAAALATLSALWMAFLFDPTLTVDLTSETSFAAAT